MDRQNTLEIRIIFRSSFLISIFIFLSFSLPFVQAQDIVWSQTENPSKFVDQAIDVTCDDKYIYIIGEDESQGSGNTQWRIEKRSKLDGELIWVQTENPSSGCDLPIAITSDDNYIYVGGLDSSYCLVRCYYQWRIEKRNKSDGSLIWIQTEKLSTKDDDSIKDIVCDTDYIYIVGDDYTPLILPPHGFYPQWRIEKRRKSDGSIVWIQTEDISKSYDSATAVTSDTTYIYIGGYASPNGTLQWRIEKRNKSDGAVVWSHTEKLSNGNDSINSLTADDNHIYIVGKDCSSGENNSQWRIEKRQKTDGAMVWNQTGKQSGRNNEARSIASDEKFIYIIGSLESEREWRVEKRNKSDGSIAWERTECPSGRADTPLSVASDNNYLYIVGFEYPPMGPEIGPGNCQWRIEKRIKVPYVDIGLCAHDGTRIIKIACEPAGILTSSLRIHKKGTNYGIVLINPMDILASKIRIKTSSGIKALRRF